MSRRATYRDVLDAPEGVTAELVDGELSLSPQPAIGPQRLALAIGVDLGGPYWRGRGGPGGWVFATEPELWLGAPDPASLVLVPDVAGWRAERFPADTATHGVTVPPDWVCEVLSPSTARRDRLVKLPRYGACGVGWCWIVDPAAETVEVYALSVDGPPRFVAAAHREVEARLPPFDAVPLDASSWWPTAPGAPRSGG